MSRGVNFMSVRERRAGPFVDPKKENRLERERMARRCMRSMS